MEMFQLGAVLIRPLRYILCTCACTWICFWAIGQHFVADFFALYFKLDIGRMLLHLTLLVSEREKPVFHLCAVPQVDRYPPVDLLFS